MKAPARCSALLSVINFDPRITMRNLIKNQRTICLCFFSPDRDTFIIVPIAIEFFITILFTLRWDYLKA